MAIQHQHNFGKQKISTTIDSELRNSIKADGYKYNELIIMGYQAKKNFPPLQARMRKQEDALLKLNAIIRSQAEKIMILESAVTLQKERRRPLFGRKRG